MGKQCVLILGGARSGKSRFAQQLAAELGEQVLFVATASALDEEMKRRIEAHRKARPQDWRTLEVSTRVGRRIMELVGDTGVVLLDCVTLLISHVFGEREERHSLEEEGEPFLEKQVALELEELIACIEQLDATFIIVSNEVGMGLVPVNELGRAYRDLLGKANQELARCADRVYLMIAGMPIQIKPSASLGAFD